MKTKNEHYYASELNRFIDENCSHEMDCINFDAVLVKVAKKRIRFLEAKRENEGLAKSESRVFNILRFLLGNINKEWKIEYFIVRSDATFENNFIQEMDGEPFAFLNKADLIRWINFEIEIRQSQKDECYRKLTESGDI
jgi:hypothetical protein